MSKQVLSVGNCSYDNGQLRSFLKTHFDVEFTVARYHDEALEALRRGAFDLVLVNRKAAADHSYGLEFIQRIKNDSTLRETPVMMLTNFAEHQAGAVAEGAEPGFGKSGIGSTETVELLAKYLAPPVA